MTLVIKCYLLCLSGRNQKGLSLLYMKLCCLHNTIWCDNSISLTHSLYICWKAMNSYDNCTNNRRIFNGRTIHLVTYILVEKKCMWPEYLSTNLFANMIFTFGYIRDWNAWMRKKKFVWPEGLSILSVYKLFAKSRAVSALTLGLCRSQVRSTSDFKAFTHKAKHHFASVSYTAKVVCIVEAQRATAAYMTTAWQRHPSLN